MSRLPTAVISARRGSTAVARRSPNALRRRYRLAGLKDLRQAPHPVGRRDVSRVPSRNQRKISTAWVKQPQLTSAGPGAPTPSLAEWLTADPPVLRTGVRF